MEFFKKQYQILSLVAFILLGCSSDDEKNNVLEIKVTNFETSYSRVKLNWEILRPNGIIIFITSPKIIISNYIFFILHFGKIRKSHHTNV